MEPFRILILRIFFAVSTEEAAAQMMARLVQMVEPHASVTRTTTERYWKIPEYFEVTIYIAPTSDPATLFDKLLRLIGAGWIRTGDDSEWGAVWTKEMSSEARLANMQWASLDVIIPPEGASGADSP